MDQHATRHLIQTKTYKAFNVQAAAMDVAQRGGPGPWQQMIQIIGLRFGRPRFKPVDYYTYGFYRKSVTPSVRRTYLPAGAERAFHTDLTGPDFARFDKLLTDKIAFERLAQANGIAVAQTRAVFGGDPHDPRGTTGPRALSSVQDITAFLSDPENLPLFGKPRFGSHGIGVVSVRSVDAAGILTLANGATCTVSALAQEIATDWPTGYLFQTPLLNHAVLRPHLGLATCGTRICTVLGADGPRLLYAVQRLPTAGAIHDGAVGGRRGFGAINPATGAITRIAERGKPLNSGLMHWNCDTSPLVGVVIPYFDGAVALAIAAHRAIGGLAVCGFDVVITDTGPCIMEANTNPHAIIYQSGHDAGLLSPENRELFAQAKAILQPGAAKGGN